MGRIYFYKMTTDNGGAPCVSNGLLSLAICKPMIRHTADEGDILFGFAANSLDAGNRLIYAAKVTKRLDDGAYYRKKEFSSRHDCIYRFDNGQYVAKKNRRYHKETGNLEHDLGRLDEGYPRANVLLSTEFLYFGDSSDAGFSASQRIIEALECLKQGHRVNHVTELRKELFQFWKNLNKDFPQSVNGKPSQSLNISGCNCRTDDGLILESDNTVRDLC